MNRLVLPLRAPAVRIALIFGLSTGLTACANEPSRGPATFAPMMMVQGPSVAVVETASSAEPSDPLHELTRKSLAAKVLASRALETVTGLPIDPARFSEHD